MQTQQTPQRTGVDTTRLAIDRTILANERTYQAWIRTGLAALAGGLGAARFLQESMERWMLLSIASILIAFSILAFCLAAWRYAHLHLRISAPDVDRTPLWMVRLVSVFLSLMALLALAGVYTAAFS